MSQQAGVSVRKANKLTYNNGWLSGFFDADGSFYLNWSKNDKNIIINLQYYLRISQRQNYHLNSLLFSSSYYNCLNSISAFLSAPLRNIDRKRKNGYLEKAFEVRSSNFVANYIFISYFLKYPLFSYKYKSINIFTQLIQLTINKSYKLKGVEFLSNLKNGMITESSNQSSHNINTHYEYISNNFPFFK